MAHDVIC